MREFSDAEGRGWRATVREESGPDYKADYKGRFYLVLERADGKPDEALELAEVRWNSERTAERTITTMSTVELRRRLRQALGRSLERRAG